MTYTRFEVKKAKNSAKIPEYTLFMPDPSPSENTSVPTKPLAEQQEPKVRNGPEIICEPSHFESVSTRKSAGTFYTIAVILSISFFVFFGFAIKFALDNKLFIPEPVCEFYTRVSYAIENQSFSAFSQYEKKEPDFDIEETFYENNETQIPPIKNDSYVPDDTITATPPSVAVSSTENSIAEDSGKPAYPIIKTDVSRYGESTIINETSYSPDLNKLAENTLSVFAPQNAPYDTSLPLVLIYHTHGTESYNPKSDYYTKDTPTRSSNTDNNVVSIGKELKDILLSFGINAIHCETMHDKDDYNSSYTNSYKTVEDYLSKYPSIKYTIDIHRDSIVKTNNEKIRTWTEWGGGSAQIMLVVGTDDSGKDHPNWENNLALATSLENRLNQLYPTFARPINLRKSRFNQNLCSGSLLLEVGSCGNTLDDAKNAIRLFGPVYAKIILQNETN